MHGLGHAAAQHDLHLRAIRGLGGLVERLLLRGRLHRAGVDVDQVRVLVVGQRGPVLQELARDDVRVRLVVRAAHRYHVDLNPVQNIGLRL